MRLLLVLALGLGFLVSSLPRAMAEDDTAVTERVPSSPKKNKKKKRGGKPRKKHGAKVSKSSKHKSQAAKPRTHAPKASAAPTAPQYPTQPGGSGFADIPNEKKDDLPPPAPAPNE